MVFGSLLLLWRVLSCQSFKKAVLDRLAPFVDARAGCVEAAAAVWSKKRGDLMLMLTG